MNSEELDGRRVAFVEEQRVVSGWRWLAVMAAVVGLAVVVRQILAHPEPADRTAGLVAGFLIFPLLAALVIWLKLTVSVTDAQVTVHYRPFWRRTIPMSEILTCAARTYRPLREFGGWGLRRGRHGWAYTVSGEEGVDLELTGERRVLIGSRRAGELARAIQERLRQR